METESALSLIVFCLAVFSGGYLNAIRHVFSFFRQYQDRIDDDRLRETIHRSIEHWKRDGYAELCSLSQLVFDGMAVLSATHVGKAILSSHTTLPGPSAVILAAALSILAVYLVSHQLFPVLGQAFLARFAHSMYFTFSFYWLLTGWIGVAIFKINRALLKKAGVYRKYKIISENDFKKQDVVSTGFSDKGLEEDEAEMVQNIFNFSNTQVKEIFTPRVDTVAIDVKSTFEEVIDLIKTKKYTRIPVYEDNIDNIKGILHIKELLSTGKMENRENFNLENVLRPAYFIPRSKIIGDLMAEFKIEHIHMAVVVDEYGGTAGIITLEDILEEIVGEIQDEDDKEIPKIMKINDHTYIVDPIITLDDINRELDIQLRPKDDVEIDTLGGLLQYNKGSIPQEGDKLSANGCLFEILKMEGQSIEKVRLIKNLSEKA